MNEDTALAAPCSPEGEVYVGHGVDLVMVAFTREVRWWRNSAWLKPDGARTLAAALLQQAAAAETIEQSDDREGAS